MGEVVVGFGIWGWSFERPSEGIGGVGLGWVSFLSF